MSQKIIINEVDCYEGNASRTKYATSKAVQHQIMLIVNNQELYLGRRNSVSDQDRSERIVLNKEVDAEMINLFNKANMLKDSMKSEFCNSIEEYNIAAKYNEPIKTKIKELINAMWLIEDLDLSFEQYYRHINY